MKDLKDGGIFLHPHEIGKEEEIVSQWKAQGKQMPLIKSPSKKAREKNIEIEIAAGKKPKQAVAIGYSVQKEAKKSSKSK